MASIKIGEIIFDDSMNQSVLLLQRHLQQAKPPGAKSDDWLPTMPLDLNIAQQQAPLIRNDYLKDVPVAIGGCSHLVRTLQTLALICPQAQEIVRLDSLTPPDCVNRFGTWECLQSMKTEKASEMFELAPDLFTQLGSIGMEDMRRVMQQVGNGKVAYFCSHNPICEAITANYFGGVDKLPIPNYGKGDIGAFIFRDGRPVYWSYLQAPTVPISPAVLAADTQYHREAIAA